MTTALVHTFRPRFTWTNHKWRLSMIAALANAKGKNK